MARVVFVTDIHGNRRSYGELFDHAAAEGADAVVFVADSRKSSFKENLAAFENMKVNLLANRLVPEKVPLVLQ